MKNLLLSLLLCVPAAAGDNFQRRAQCRGQGRRSCRVRVKRTDEAKERAEKSEQRRAKSERLEITETSVQTKPLGRQGRVDPIFHRLLAR